MNFKVLILVSVLSMVTLLPKAFSSEDTCQDLLNQRIKNKTIQMAQNIIEEIDWEKNRVPVVVKVIMLDSAEALGSNYYQMQVTVDFGGQKQEKWEILLSEKKNRNGIVEAKLNKVLFNRSQI